MPYAREFLTPAGLINDPFETAITWDRFGSFHEKVKAATERAILKATGLKGEITYRFTLHPCLSGRARAVFFLPRTRPPRCSSGAVAGDQECGQRRAD
jgi:hypothetical protein